MQLLELMLEFNPVFRPSAADLLKLPIFNDVREPKMEAWIRDKAPLQFETTSNMKSVAISAEDASAAASTEKDDEESINDELRMWRTANVCSDKQQLEQIRLDIAYLVELNFQQRPKLK